MWMSIREKLKQREKRRDAAANGGNEFPEGVTRYVKLGQELKNGKTFIMLADPDNWFWYYVHEDGDYATRSTYVRKHTCLHSPRGLGEDFDKYEKPNKDVCISCKAGAKRRLYFLMPVYDPQYKTWRVLDLKEYHAMNLIGDYDKLEKGAKKFNKDYTLVEDAVIISKSADGKTYTLDGADTEGLEEHLEEAKKFIGIDFNYEELANFRELDEIVKILEEASDEHVDKSVLPGANETEENYDF
jgi:hypothetical protein